MEEFIGMGLVLVRQLFFVFVALVLSSCVRNEGGHSGKGVKLKLFSDVDTDGRVFVRGHIVNKSNKEFYLLKSKADNYTFGIDPIFFCLKREIGSQRFPEDFQAAFKEFKTEVGEPINDVTPVLYVGDILQIRPKNKSELFSVDSSSRKSGLKKYRCYYRFKRKFTPSHFLKEEEFDRLTDIELISNELTIDRDLFY